MLENIDKPVHKSDIFTEKAREAGNRLIVYNVSHPNVVSDVC